MWEVTRMTDVCWPEFNWWKLVIELSSVIFLHEDWEVLWNLQSSILLGIWLVQYLGNGDVGNNHMKHLFGTLRKAFDCFSKKRIKEKLLIAMELMFHANEDNPHMITELVQGSASLSAGSKNIFPLLSMLGVNLPGSWSFWKCSYSC